MRDIRDSREIHTIINAAAIERKRGEAYRTVITVLEKTATGYETLSTSKFTNILQGDSLKDKINRVANRTRVTESTLICVFIQDDTGNKMLSALDGKTLEVNDILGDMDLGIEPVPGL